MSKGSFFGVAAVVSVLVGAMTAPHWAPRVIWRIRCRQVAGNNKGPLPWTLDGAESFTYRSVAGRDLRIHVFTPKGPRIPRPAVLLFFGGGWRGGSVQSVAERAQALADQGMVAAIADYRVGSRDRTVPTDSLVDAQAAYQWIRARATSLAIDPSRLVLGGGSSGGHLALTTTLLASAAERPAALVLFNPAVDLVSVATYIGLRSAQARAISPSELSLEGLPPTLIFHGVNDRVVPIANVRDFAARASQNCALIEYPDYGHSFYHLKAADDVLGGSPYQDTTEKTLEFLEQQGLLTKHD